MTVTDVVVACALLVVSGCGTPSPPRANELATANTDAVAAPTVVGAGTHVAARQPPVATPHAAQSATSASTFHPDDNPACSDLSTLTSEIHLWQVAASPQPHRRKVAARWPTLPPACRGGTFYLVAAELVGRATDAKLTTADGTVVVRSSGDALAQGFASEPDHPRLLAHLAFIDDLLPDRAPPLPADACARVHARGGDAWTDYAAYICALTAIHAGDGAAALTELDGVHSAVAFPDLQIRRSQALVLAGKPKEAQALAKQAVDTLAKAPPRFDLTPAAIDALKKKLTAH